MFDLKILQFEDLKIAWNPEHFQIISSSNFQITNNLNAFHRFLHVMHP